MIFWECAPAIKKKVFLLMEMCWNVLRLNKFLLNMGMGTFSYILKASDGLWTKVYNIRKRWNGLEADKLEKKQSKTYKI